MGGDPYTTHVPILAQAVLMTKGPVLEFGAGWGSTPLLHALCRGRRLITYETLGPWLKKFERLSSEFHTLLHVAGWKEVMEATLPERVGVAFVDCEPGEARAPLINWLRDKCDLVVVHDTEKDWGVGADYKYEAIFSKYKHRADYRFLRPYTTVVSEVMQFPIDPDEETWMPSDEQLAYFREKGITK